LPGTQVRKAVYHIDESYKDKMPAKVSSGLYEDQIEYAKKLTG
jgi:hypothetical protein